MEADSKFSLVDICNLFQKDPLPNNTSNFCRQMIIMDMESNYIQKISDLLLNIKTIKQTHKIMMDGVGGGGYRKSPVFADYHVFALASYIERCMEDAIFMFLKKMIQLWPLQICLETLSVYIHLKMVTEEVVICIMAHVLIQMRCCLFPVILSSFHRLGRRNYIRAVKRYNENLSMLYTMIVK